LDTVAALTGRSTDTLETEMLSVIEKNPVMCEKLFQAEKAPSLRIKRTLYYGGRDSRSNGEKKSLQRFVKKLLIPSFKNIGIILVELLQRKS